MIEVAQNQNRLKDVVVLRLFLLNYYNDENVREGGHSLFWAGLCQFPMDADKIKRVFFPLN